MATPVPIKPRAPEPGRPPDTRRPPHSPSPVLSAVPEAHGVGSGWTTMTAATAATGVVAGTTASRAGASGVEATGPADEDTPGRRRTLKYRNRPATRVGRNIYRRVDEPTPVPYATPLPRRAAAGVSRAGGPSPGGGRGPGGTSVSPDDEPLVPVDPGVRLGGVGSTPPPGAPPLRRAWGPARGQEATPDTPTRGEPLDQESGSGVVDTGTPVGGPPREE